MKDNGKDFLAILHLNYKLIFRNKGVWISLIIAILLFFLVIQPLAGSVEESSHVPIGIVDYDNTTSSKEFVQRLKKIQVLSLYEQEQASLEEKRAEGLIAAYFVLQKGFSEKILDGDVKEFIELHPGQSKGLANMVADIVAGEVMYDICRAKVLMLYKELLFQYDLPNEIELVKYMDQIKEQKEFQFRFDIEMVDLKSSDNLEYNIENSLIYKQVVIALISILFSFLALFFVCSIMKYNSKEVKDRRQLTHMNKYVILLGDFLAVFTILGALSVATSFCIYYLLQKEQIEVLLYLFGVQLLFHAFISILFLMLGKIVRSEQLLQFVGAFFVLILGGAGVVGFLMEHFLFFSKITPNYWFIKGITDIMINRL